MRLSARQLNRATLARQMLLARQPAAVVDAVDRLGGLQAQEPASPYLALWTRLAGFSPGSVDDAIARHELVKATLGRSTLHLVSRADYLASITALLAVTRGRWMQERRGLPVRRALPELTEDSLAYAAEPRTNVELRDHAGTLGEPVPADELWRRIRRYGAFLHVPVEAPWSFDRRPVQVAARAWLPEPEPDEDASLAHVVRRHLQAFGPSRLADIAQWSGLTITRLKRGLARLDAVERHENEAGQELWDLAGAPLPDPDTPAPPRLLPMWDETLLAYADRSRTLPAEYRKRVIVKAGDVLPTFTLDGRVAGLWWAERGDATTPRIVLEPFGHLRPADREALEAEGTALAQLIADREPEVFRRYRFTRRRDEPAARPEPA
jgi:hypothetical protein